MKGASIYRLKGMSTRKHRNPAYGCSDIKVLVPATTSGIFQLKEIIPIASVKRPAKTTRKSKLKLVDDSRISERYNKWRRSILSRDKYQCILCEGKERIEAHHITRWVDNENLRFNSANGAALCFNCHDKYHNHNKERFPIKITNILKKYVEFRTRLNKVPRETDYNVDQAVNSRTNKNVTVLRRIKAVSA